MSVFTFDPNPPRVSSPWLRPSASEPSTTPTGSLQDGLLSDYGVTRLEAEPQDGPTEYKLHLLLRPRRAYKSMTTTSHVYGYAPSTKQPQRDAKPDKAAATPPLSSSSPSPHSRQTRLEHLTTQLLWRLQQSCPYHAASTTTELVVPQLQDANDGSNGAVKVGRVLPGLEASRGALYEIGVADNGTLVGLTRNELDESLVTLRIMAASLGCNVKILRMVIVGQCEWVDAPNDYEQSGPNAVTHSGAVHTEKLWVGEALVTPNLGSKDAAAGAVSSGPYPPPTVVGTPAPRHGPLATQQLRVTLTGPTTSGKSTLLGTLSTGTLDNGQGSSRLNLLKHRHELATGVTSSVAQELIGYHDNHIFNYTHDGIESWIDIHDFTKDGRLVFLLDSGGHPRYRRTILRGIVGWAADWTLLCIGADDMEVGSDSGASTPAEDVSGTVGAGIDLSKAHLDLCLNLELPLVVVITKLDLANRTALQHTLGKVLSSLKAAGRIPKILQPDQSSNHDLTEIPERDIDSVGAVIEAIKQSGNLRSIVPIVLTSAAKGRGIGLMHALLQGLPLPPPPTSRDYIGHALNPEQPACLFHIEDKFSLPAAYAAPSPNGASQQTDMGTVVAGYLRFGSLSVGDKVVIGPFPSNEEGSRGPAQEDRSSPSSFGLSISHPSAVELGRTAMKNAVSASTIKGEWHSANIVSARNLRLPVQTLDAGQVGSIGIVFDPLKEEPSPDGLDRPAPSMPKLRKGMVLAIPSKHMIDTGLSLQAASGLTAAFSNKDAASLTVGSLVNIFVASVRAAARVLDVTRINLASDASPTASDDDDGIFDFNEQNDADTSQPRTPTGVEVQLELLASREWIELGSRIVILEGGSKDKSGLEGLVGKVMEIVD